jgi:hypothetical protein
MYQKILHADSGMTGGCHTICGLVLKHHRKSTLRPENVTCGRCLKSLAAQQNNLGGSRVSEVPNP